MAAILLRDKRIRVLYIPIITLLGITEVSLSRSIGCLNGLDHNDKVIDRRGTTFLAMLVIASANIFAFGYKIKQFAKKRSENRKECEKEGGKICEKDMTTLYPSLNEFHIPNALPISHDLMEVKLKHIIQQLQSCQSKTNIYLHEMDKVTLFVLENGGNKQNELIQELQVIRGKVEQDAFTANEHLAKWELLQKEHCNILEFIQGYKLIEK